MKSLVYGELGVGVKLGVCDLVGDIVGVLETDILGVIEAVLETDILGVTDAVTDGVIDAVVVGVGDAVLDRDGDGVGGDPPQAASDCINPFWSINTPHSVTPSVI